jgi:hypothetical protein
MDEGPQHVDCVWKGWRYGLSVSYRSDDARASISAIWVESLKWRTATDVGVDTPFKYVLNKINETIDRNWPTHCDRWRCITRDAGGLKLEANNRDSTLRIMLVYEPHDSWGCGFWPYAKGERA